MKMRGSFLEALEPFFEKVGKLTKVQRVLICCAAFFVLIGAFVYFSFLPKYEKISQLKQEYQQLQQQLTAAREKAKQLNQVRKDFAAAQEDFERVKRSLPDTKEIPELLETISRSGQEAGLDFLLFEPKAEQNKEFYSEIPVAIQVEGKYSNLEVFLDKVSTLHRIVNIDNVKIQPIKDSDKLKTICTAVTYRFIEPKVEDQKATQVKNQKKK